MLDGKAYKALLSDDTDPDLVPRLRDPALLNAFAALADDLRKVMGQIASGKDADRLDDFVRYGADRSPGAHNSRPQIAGPKRLLGLDALQVDVHAVTEMAPVPSHRTGLFLVQWLSLHNFSDQLRRGRVETCLLLFFGQILLGALTAARCEPLASSMPFLCQPGKDQRKPRRVPYLRVVDCFRVIDCLRDVFLRIRHYPFSWHFLSINARHATCFVEHLAGFF
jgi:hypothetical protein